MRLFLDFEASSLGKRSYPIEIGWVLEDGRSAGFLIQPAPDWTDWDDEAASVHGISRETLLREGITPADACARLIAAAEGCTLYASAPSWDGKWLSVLLRAAGHPRHMLRLRDTEEVFIAAARTRLGSSASEATVKDAIVRARAVVEAGPIAHRAVEDARREWRIVTEVSRAGT